MDAYFGFRQLWRICKVFLFPFLSRGCIHVIVVHILFLFGPCFFVLINLQASKTVANVLTQLIHSHCQTPRGAQLGVEERMHGTQLGVEERMQGAQLGVEERMQGTQLGVEERMQGTSQVALLNFEYNDRRKKKKPILN